MNFRKTLDKYWEVILYLFISVYSVLPFTVTGFFKIHDDVQVARVYEMAKSLAMGQFPVRWVFDLGYGIGYPIFNFYSILPYYLGGVAAIISGDSLFATKLVFVIAIILSGLSMYWLVSEIYNKLSGLAAAVIYLYFPYHAVNIYVRGDLAELWAYVFLPLVFLGLFKIHQGNYTKKYLLITSVSVAAVITSHNLSAFMLFIFAGLFVFYSVATNKLDRNRAFSYVFVFVLAFLLSAFYAIPASLEAKYTNVMTQVGGGADWRDHFVCVNQFWDSPWGFGGSTNTCQDGLSFRLGKTNIIFTAIGLLLFIHSAIYKKKQQALIGIIICFLMLSVFMMLPLSAILWNLPFIDFLQYPWRFLNFTALFMSMVIGYVVYWITKNYDSRFGLIAAILIIFSTLFVNGKLFAPQEYLSRNTKFYTNSNYLNWTASKISDEYLPNSFLRPKSQSEINSIKLKKNYLFRPDSSLNSRYIFSQTPIEIISNALSLVGVALLFVVIISKRNIFYGKKTS